MRHSRIKWMAVGATLLALVATLQAGGWAIVTVRNLPEYAVAGKPFQLEFTVRGHGIEPLGELEPKLTATSGESVVKASAVASKKKGEYAANLTLPRPGVWTIEITGTIDDPTLPGLVVIAPGTPAPVPMSQSALGERLFVSKGCIGCHQDGVGPELTGRRFPETYLKSLLADPRSAFASLDAERTWRMPNLELSKSEISALTAFINRQRP